MAFCLSLLFAVIFVLAYMLTADLVAQHVPEETGSFFAVWLPPILISLAASILCSATMFLFKTKLIVPVSFLFLAAYYILFSLILRGYYSGPEDGLAVLMQLVRVYMLPAALMSNLVGWGSYLLYFKKKDAYGKSEEGF